MSTTLSGSRWGAGFSAVARFVAEIEAAAASTGPLRPGYVLAGDEDIEQPEVTIEPWIAKVSSSGSLLWQHLYYQVYKPTGLPLSEDFSGAAMTSAGTVGSETPAEATAINAVDGDLGAVRHAQRDFLKDGIAPVAHADAVYVEAGGALRDHHRRGPLPIGAAVARRRQVHRRAGRQGALHRHFVAGPASHLSAFTIRFTSYLIMAR
jgi:hypothetical protein